MTARNDPKPSPGPARAPAPSPAAPVVEEELNPHEAAFRNHVEALKKGVEKAKTPDIKDSENATPLHHAAVAGALDCLKYLLASGADVNGVDNECSYFSLLFLFPFDKWHALHTEKTQTVRTALHKAAFEGNPECVELLLASGASLGAKDQGGATPLHLAALSGSVPCLELLMKKGSLPLRVTFED